MATKATISQWVDEVERFSTLRAGTMKDTYNGLKSYEARYAQTRDFLEQDNQDVLVCKYTSMIGRRRQVEG